MTGAIVAQAGLDINIAPGALVAFILGNLFSLIGLLGLGTLVYAYLAERAEDRTFQEELEAAGERIDGILGGLLGGVNALITTMFMVGITIGNQVADLASNILGMTGAPGFIGQVILGLLGYAGLRGILPISAELYGYVFIVLTVAIGGYIYQMRSGRSRSRSGARSGAVLAPVGLLAQLDGGAMAGAAVGQLGVGALLEVATAATLGGMLAMLAVLSFWSWRRYQGSGEDPVIRAAMETDVSYSSILISEFGAILAVVGAYYLFALPLLPAFPWLVFPPLPFMIYNYMVEKQEASAA
jgi:hypothetical protein